MRRNDSPFDYIEKKTRGIFRYVAGVFMFYICVILLVFGLLIWGATVLIQGISQHGLKGVIDSIWHGPTNMVERAEN